jgi:hypothetical protein
LAAAFDQIFRSNGAIKMTDDINAVAKAIKHCLDIKDFANNATLANAAIETLKSLGWTPPTEREAIRAAALMAAEEAALGPVFSTLNNHGEPRYHGTEDDHWSVPQPKANVHVKANSYGTARYDAAKAIAALATLPPDYVVVKREEWHDLKQNVIAFAAPRAAEYAREAGFADGELLAEHYDLLERCGARMVCFKRKATP